VRVSIVAGRSGHTAPFARRLLDRGATLTVAEVEPGDAGVLADLPHRRRDDPAELARDADVVLVLEDREDGARHGCLAAAHLAAGLPVFVDKPLAPGAEAAVALLDLADAHGGRLLTTSSARYAEPVGQLRAHHAAGGLASLVLSGTGTPWFYGVHLAEVAVAVLGPGFTELRSLDDPVGLTARARHRSGTTITFVLEPAEGVAEGFGLVARGPGLVHAWSLTDYAPWYDRLVDDVMALARTGVPPVPREETLAVIGLLDALEHADHEPRLVPGQGGPA